ncbi:hypothetical protein KY290_012975 [Solanum tuberosum]|uniref:Uncharacterized protein n=1 Tax=Solanum tuberosum TaxID=4113 RepID=A0ABQ7VKG3_SOLTU|nr:hypothetical protein KY285_012739 [Solanum tuberosum]KAH0768994.1 hypothetical protein KY290_012975 [Solanum tuberosum]
MDSNPPVGFKIHGEDGEGFDISQLNEKIIGVEAGLSAINRRLAEVNKEGMTNLELKLTEALFSLHRKFKDLKAHVDETAIAGVASRVIIRETCIEAPKSKEFRGKRNV